MLDTMVRVHNVRPATLPRPAQVTRIIAENSRTRTLVFDLRLDARPGQFVMVWLPGHDEKPFSVTGVDPLRLTIARVGKFSSALHELRVGDRLGIRGPFGHGFVLSRGSALLVGGGYGAAPLAFLAERLLAAGSHVSVALGARTAAELILSDRFRGLGITPYLATEDGTQGYPGRVTDMVHDILEQQVIAAMYACGPNGMLDSLERLCRAAGVPAQLSREAYMRCGTGICGSCEHEGHLVCRDGPVFGVDPAAEPARLPQGAWLLAEQTWPA